MAGRGSARLDVPPRSHHPFSVCVCRRPLPGDPHRAHSQRSAVPPRDDVLGKDRRPPRGPRSSTVMCLRLSQRPPLRGHRPARCSGSVHQEPVDNSLPPGPAPSYASPAAGRWAPTSQDRCTASLPGVGPRRTPSAQSFRAARPEGPEVVVAGDSTGAPHRCSGLMYGIVLPRSPSPVPRDREEPPSSRCRRSRMPQRPVGEEEQVLPA